MNNTHTFTRVVRVANFTTVHLSNEYQLNVASTDVQSIVATMRTYADLPYVFLVSVTQADLLYEILTTLKERQSPCYPYAIFTIDDGDLQGDIVDLDVRKVESTDPAIIEKQIAVYTKSRLIFNPEKLRLKHSIPLPEKTDVVIVGAGITGLYAANVLKKKNISFCIIDKRDSIGGIWSMYANTTSRVNTSEGAYRLNENKIRSNRDHSSTRELLEDMVYLSEHFTNTIYLNREVTAIKKVADGYHLEYTQKGVNKSVESTGVILAINDRIGEPRTVKYANQSTFQGCIVDGFSNKTHHIDWSDKDVVIVGMGAFAVENARTALEMGAAHVTLVCRRHGTICPKIIDYLNFATPYDDEFKHDNKSNARTMMYWKKLYDLSGATQPECWMKLIKHEGHTISVSDIWFIGHYLKKIETILGSISELYDKGVIVNNQKRIKADILVNCIGFTRNGSLAKKICAYEKMYNNNYVDKNFMYLADAYIDNDAFNSFFGSSVLEMTKFYLEVFVQYFNNPDFDKMMKYDGITTIPIEDRRWSHYIKAATSLIKNDKSLYACAKKQVEQRTKNFLDVHDLKTYIAENKREWIDNHSMLAGKTMTEDQCLPYVFEKLVPK